MKGLILTFAEMSDYHTGQSYSEQVRCQGLNNQGDASTQDSIRLVGPRNLIIAERFTLQECEMLCEVKTPLLGYLG